MSELFAEVFTVFVAPDTVFRTLTWRLLKNHIGLALLQRFDVTFDILDGELHLRHCDRFVLLIMREVVSVEDVIFYRLRVLGNSLHMMRPNEPFLIFVFGNRIFNVAMVIVNRKVQWVAGRDVVV